MAGELAEILEIGRRMTDAPDIYIEAAAYWVVSSTLGKHVVIPYYPAPPDRPVRPALWVLIAGLPGIMRKSTVIESIGKNLVRAALREYYQRVAPGLTPQQIAEHIARMFIETGSYEGIAKHIAENQETVDTFYLVSPEWGGVLQTMKRREYMTGFATLLSKLYSGEEHVVRLVRETRFVRGGLYVTALLGMQEPWLYLDNMVFRQGLMRRTIIVYAEPRDKTRWLPPLSLERAQLLDQLADVAARLAEKMVRYSEYAPVVAHLTGEAIEAVNEFARRVEQEIIESEAPGNWALYSQNLWDHLTRLAVVHAIDRWDEPEDRPSGPVIVVEKSDVDAALGFLERTRQGAMKAVSLTGAKVETHALRLADTAENAVLQAIKRRACEGASTTVLLRETRLLKDELKKLVLNLVEKEEVSAFTVKTRGRPRIVFVAREHRHCYLTRVPVAEEISPKALEEIW